MAKFSILHNPRCSKSRQTLQLLRDNGVEPEIIEYLNKPPSQAAIKRILKQLDLPARAILRKGEAHYKDNGFADESLTQAQLIKMMIAHPKVIERPIVFTETAAVIGRPPENVNELLK